MGYIQSGASLHKLKITDEFNGARITVFPRDAVGSYVLSVNSTASIAGGTAANSVLMTFKNSGTNQIVIREIKIGIQTTTGYGARNGIRFSGYIVRNSFTQGTTGGTLVDLSSDTVRKRTTGMATTTASVVVCGSGGITGDTATDEDVLPFGTSLFELLTTIGTNPDSGLVNLYEMSWAEFPLILEPEEGFRIKNNTAFPATGAVTLVVKINYDEVTTY